MLPWTIFIMSWTVFHRETRTLGEDEDEEEEEEIKLQSLPPIPGTTVLSRDSGKMMMIMMMMMMMRMRMMMIMMMMRMMTIIMMMMIRMRMIIPGLRQKTGKIMSSPIASL